MIVLNTRRGDGTMRHGPPPATWHRLAVKLPTISPAEAHADLRGRKFCLLIHGFNVKDAFGSYVGAIPFGCAVQDKRHCRLRARRSEARETWTAVQP